MAEGSEFELSVPVAKLSDDGIMLEFATAKRIALIAQYCRRYCASAAVLAGRGGECYRNRQGPIGLRYLSDLRKAGLKMSHPSFVARHVVEQKKRPNPSESGP